MSEREKSSRRFISIAIGAFGGLLVLTSGVRTALAFWLAPRIGMTAAELIGVIATGPSREIEYSGTLVRAIILLYKAGYQLVIGALLIWIALQHRSSPRLFGTRRRETGVNQPEFPENSPD